MTVSLDAPVPGELPGTCGTPGGTAGSPVSDRLLDVDRRISLAFLDLARARTRFAVAPSGESLTACVSAEDAVNELLDLRLALAPRATTAGLGAPG